MSTGPTLGRVGAFGHDGVRDYWTRQWSAIDPVAEPVNFTTRRPPSRSIRWRAASSGTLFGERRVLHVYGFRDDLIDRIDVEELARAG
jgi:hypothetical protein